MGLPGVAQGSQRTLTEASDEISSDQARSIANDLLRLSKDSSARDPSDGSPAADSRAAAGRYTALTRFLIGKLVVRVLLEGVLSGRIGITRAAHRLLRFYCPGKRASAP